MRLSYIKHDTRLRYATEVRCVNHLYVELKQAIGSHLDERLDNKVFVAMLRQTLGLSVLPSSNNSMGSAESDGDCLICGDNLDGRGRHARRCSGSNLATRVHTDLKYGVKTMVLAASAIPGSGISNVGSETPGLIYSNGRPGDISFDYNGVTVAVDAYTLDAAAPSNMYTDVDKLFDAEERVKGVRYGELCDDRNVLFFTFGMASMGRLSDSADQFIRWLANCLPETECSRNMFRQYWSRRVVVRTLKRQMVHLIARQEDRSPRYTRVVEEASRLDTCVWSMPGGNLNGLNRGMRRHPSAFRQRRPSDRSFRLRMGGVLSEVGVGGV